MLTMPTPLRGLVDVSLNALMRTFRRGDREAYRADGVDVNASPALVPARCRGLIPNTESAYT